ncbi:hypothetical protein [uncultured Mediterranean phage uvMED]|nr:hypothetical protein [uncultured Mediterranean phage uvMED]
MSYIKTFIHAIANSYLPEKIDIDDMDNTLSEDITKGLTLFLDNQMGELEVGTVKKFDYENINKWFQSESIHDASLTSKEPGVALKRTLGTFTVKRTEDGYNITDSYDFNPFVDEHDEPYKDAEGNPRKVNYLDMLKKATSFDVYGTARAFGGLRIPEGGDNAMKIDWNLSEGQEIKRKKFTELVLANLPSKPESTSTRNREN